MSRLLKEGGKAIYVAPSGGRDRKNGKGIVEVAPFDPQSIEMFYLMAKKAKTPTHFYPLSLTTYDLLPPPDTIQKELGEARSAKYSPVHLFFAPEFDMEHFHGSDEKDKTERRKNRAYAIWNIVDKNYNHCLKLN
jgi:glycerol-3-phosphate O-acyltransferase